MKVVHAQRRQWTRDELYRMAEARLFPEGQKVELIEGEVYVMPTQGADHGGSIGGSNHILVARYGSTHVVRVQLPLTFSQITEPEPDFSLVTWAAFQAAKASGQHPQCADLVIEVARTSLAYDRDEKASLYAQAGIPEYWIVNLAAGCLEVHRQPRPDPDAPFGHSYAILKVYSGDEPCAPWFAPQTPVTARELL